MNPFRCGRLGEENTRFAYGACVLAALFCFGLTPARASLTNYDVIVDSDSAGGLRPLARLTSPLTLTGSNRGAFNFGTNSGPASFEFIVEGDPSANNSGYLAVGENSQSSLRYELWYDTGQLGFTQGGIADYPFTPGVPSPTQPAHVAYVWDPTIRTMKVYLNGKLGGTCSGVSSSFAMPEGQGWLGANPGGGEAMVGTIYRVTIYDGLVSEEVIAAHADAFNNVVRPPSILSFTATPDTLFTPAGAMLAWAVRDATAIFLDGSDVTARTNLTVSPQATTTYKLVATNSATTTSAQVTIRVNPPPGIARFGADRTYCRAGENVTLSWEVNYAQTLSLSPGVGDVTAQTVGGIGFTNVQPLASTTYLLAAGNPYGTNTANVDIHVVQPANHLVISEFMANDRSTLRDEDGEFSGWIELHNPTAAEVNLAGHFLTDKADAPMLWALPGTNLPAGGYLVVFASGKNRAQPGAELHTGFRLNNDGEYLALVGPGSVVLHEFAPAFPPQRPDISYGLLAADPALVQFLGVPTPGAPNNETAAPPAPVQFSCPGGFFTEAFPLTLSALEPGAEIWYTLDGSPPGLGKGNRYTAPLQITRTTRVRAVGLLNGLAGHLSGASYIKLAPDLAGYTSSLPIMVIENFGAGTIPRKGWNSTGAGIKQVPRQAAAWATFAPVAGYSALTNPPQMLSLVGIRGRGAYSTEWHQKPYSVEAMDEEGAEAKVSPLDLPSHADWVLYFPDAEQSMDPTLLFNTFAYELSRSMGDYAVRFRWAEAFINEDGGDLSLADRRGVYAIIEKVARGKDRLDFQQLSSDGSSGGWLLNINRMDPEPETGWPAPNGATQPWFFHTAGPDAVLQTQPNTAYTSVPGDDLPRQWNAFINFDNPNGFVINTNQRAAIEGWIKRFERVLYDNTLWRDPTNGYRRYLDTRDFVDYFILNVLTRNGDGLLLSMYPWKGDDDKFRMGPAWDYNWSSYYISGGPTGSLMHRADQLWYPRLFADPDFTQLYIDRWWELRGGPLSNEVMNAIIDRQAADITPQKALLNGMPSAAEWSNRLAQMKTWLNQRANWIDGNYLRPPALNQPGGEVPDGFLVSLTGATGTIYFTTDDTDPRAPGGSVAATARVYTGSFPLHSPTVVKARLKSGANWSGLTSGIFSTPQDLTKLVVTEIMYHPPAYGLWAADDLEFLEFKNIGTNMLNLGYLTFTAGIEFTFTNGTRLEPGRCFVVARNAAAFQTIYPGVAVNGIYTGKLSDGGEIIRLSLPSGSPVFEVTYNNHAPWPLAADGSGLSLQLKSIFADGSDPLNWVAAPATPGVDYIEPADPNLDSDGDGMPDWQEGLAGTDPTDPASRLMIDSVTVTESVGVRLSFEAISNRTYTVQRLDALGTNGWSRLADVLAQTSNRVETVIDPTPAANRFYRLVTPKQP